MAPGFPDKETFDKVYGPMTLGLIKPSWWLRFRMMFWPTIVHMRDDVTIVYKKHKRTLYVLAVVQGPSQQQKARES